MVITSTMLPRVAMLIIGIMAIRALGMSDYGLFSLALTTGIILGQFVPDSVSAYLASSMTKKNNSAEIETRIALQKGYALTIKLTIVVLAVIYVSIMLIQTFQTNTKLIICTLILSAAYPIFSISQVTSNIMALKGYETKLSINAILVAVVQVSACSFLSIIWGVIGLAIGYLLSTVLYAYVTAKIIPTDIKRELIRRVKIKRILKPTLPKGFSKLMLSLALGAPTHWVVLQVLGSSENGLFEVGKFSYAYYFYTLIVIIPSSLQSYTIGKISTTINEINSKYSAKKIFIISSGLILIFTTIVGMCLVILNQIMLPFLTSNHSESQFVVVDYSIIAGMIGTTSILISQYLIASKKYGIQLYGTLISGSIYIAASTIMILYFNFGAKGAIIGLGFAQLVQSTILLFSILRK